MNLYFSAEGKGTSISKAKVCAAEELLKILHDDSKSKFLNVYSCLTNM